MKTKIFITILLVFLQNTFCNGQFKDLLKSSKESKKEQTSVVSSDDLLKISNEPQQIVAKRFFDKYSFNGLTRIAAYSHIPKLEISSETQPSFNCSSVFPSDSKLEKDESGNVTKFLLNFNTTNSFQNTCYLYEIIHPTGAYAFGSGKMSQKYIDGTNRVESELVMFFDNFILIGTDRESGKYTLGFDFQIIGTKNVLKQISKQFNYESFKKALNEPLQNYYNQMQVLLKGGDQKMAEEKRAKFGIKGKELVSLTIEPSQYNKLYQGQVFNFDIVATLKDGSKLSTRQGFLDEYNIRVEGLEKNEFKDVDGKVTISYEIAKKYIPTNDIIKISATSKYHSNIKSAEFQAKLDYENCEWTLNDNGDQFTTHKKPAGTFRIEVKSAIDVNSKKECYAYKVYSKGELIAHFKQVKAKPIVVNARGGKGAKPNFGNQNGGNGGTITVVKDPSAKDCVIVYDINGGTGFTTNFSNGAKGTYTETIQKLAW